MFLRNRWGFASLLVLAVMAGTFVAAALAQPDVVPDIVPEKLPWYAALLAMSGVVLPLVGRLLVLLPFVDNKLIPAVNAALAVGAKYWLLLGFQLDPIGGSASMDAEVLLAGISWQAVVGTLWGLGETFLSQKLYENRKAKSRVATAMGVAQPFLAWLVPKEKRRPRA